jgi:hypothetical protein
VHVGDKTGWLADALKIKELEKVEYTKGRIYRCVSQGFAAFCSSAKSRKELPIRNCQLPIKDHLGIGNRKLAMGI